MSDRPQLGLVGTEATYEIYRGYVNHYAVRRERGAITGIAKLLPGRHFDELRYATGDGVCKVTADDIASGRLTLVETEDDES